MMKLLGCAALMLAASPAAATAGTEVSWWNGPSSFDTASMSVAPRRADTLLFLSGDPSIRLDGPMALLNIRVAEKADTGIVMHNRTVALMARGGDQTVSLRSLGWIGVGGGLIQSIGFDCDMCGAGGAAFVGFDRVSFSLFDAAEQPPAQAPDVVPEPAAWLTMLAGFTATGLLLRRRGRKGAPPATAG